MKIVDMEHSSFIYPCRVFSELMPFLSSAEMDPKERLAHQRKLLQKKLGLDIGAAIGMDTEELFNDEDLDDTCQTSGLKAHGSKAAAGSTFHNHVVGPNLVL